MAGGVSGQIQGDVQQDLSDDINNRNKTEQPLFPQSEQQGDTEFDRDGQQGAYGQSRCFAAVTVGRPCGDGFRRNSRRGNRCVRHA